MAFSASGSRLASWGCDGTALVWDTKRLVSASAGERPAPALPALWGDLASPHAAKAYQARGLLAAHPADAVKLLRERLRPLAPPDAAHLGRLLADLDSDAFTTRQQATKELAKLGELAEPALRRLLARSPSLEAQKRAEQLLERMRPDLRSSRAIAVLE